MKNINYNDKKIPLGKRKQAFVKWLVHKGESLEDAKLTCYRKFYHEIKAEERKRYEKEKRDFYNRYGYYP